MTPNLLALIGIGLVLGLRHAFEPDHLAAVSTLTTRPNSGKGGSLWPAARLGLLWGVGHTVTVGLVALLVVALGVRLPEALWPIAELVVAGLLIVLGGSVIWRYARGRWHMHLHSHPTVVEPHLHLHSHAGGIEHTHSHATINARRSLGFGVAHGLAGSGAIAALLLSAAPAGASRIAYFTAFGAGTMLGMFAVTFALTVIMRATASRGPRWATVLHVGAAALSVLAGVAIVVTS